MAMQLQDDFKEFLKLLNANEVKYLLIGGYAVSYYGYVRTTADMDVWIQLSDKNADAIVKTLRQFGFAVPGLSKQLFLKDRNVIRMGNSPLRLEIQLSISGREFDDCYSRRKEVTIDEVPVSMIGKADLILYKKAVGRPKDMLDVLELEKLD